MVVESGDPGGEPGEFEEYIEELLRVWYDGAKVTLLEKALYCLTDGERVLQLQRMDQITADEANALMGPVNRANKSDFRWVKYEE